MSVFFNCLISVKINVSEEKKMNDFKFKKKFGQNFLIDENITKNIVLKSEISPNSLIIEIGCGDGRLTKKLCATNNIVVGYEIDNEVIPLLKNNIAKFDNFYLINDDFLKRDIRDDIKDYDYENLYVIANLPYYITTPIISKIIDSKLNIRSMTIMVQKEVGDRICAKPGSKEYSSLTVYLSYYFDIKKLFNVSRNSFMPKPNVDSVVISLNRKEDMIRANNEEMFFKLVRDSFKFKRKNLRNNLRGYDLKVINKVLLKYNFDLQARAEQLTLEIFLDIANSLSI